MEYRHEIILYNDSIPVKLFIHRLGFATMHWHNSLELLFVLNGIVHINAGGTIYDLKEKDVFLINPNEPHELYSEDAVLMAVQIKLSLFDNRVLKENNLFFRLDPDKDADHPGLLRIKKILARFIKNNTMGGKEKIIRAKSLSYELLAELTESFHTSDPQLKKRHSHINDRIASIVTFINGHYQENISLQMLADNEYLSTAYLSRFFKKMMGNNFIDYVNQIRMNHAVIDILETDMTLEEISEKNGFPNKQIFSQRFRRQFGMLPSQYRKQKEKNSAGSLLPKSEQYNEYTILEPHQYLNYFADYLTSVQEETVDFCQKDSEKRILKINTAEQADPIRHTWKCFTSVGSARDLLVHDVQEMLRRVQKEIGFHYIKFHGILSDDMHIFQLNTKNEACYSFVYIDKVLDFLLSIGLKPLIELGFMPKGLSKYPDHFIYDTNMINSPPNDIEKWKGLICAFLQHILHKYGKEEVQSWMITVWNEPDTPESMFGFPDTYDFLQFWKETYEVIRREAPGLPIGSPSTYCDIEYNLSFLDTFIVFCKEHSCMPDSILIHYYGTSLKREILYQIGKEIQYTRIQLTTDEQLLHKSIQSIRFYMEQLGIQDLPLYLTEWNFSPAHQELLGDTCFRACYIVKNILETMDELDSMGYWMLTDAFEEYQISNDLFQGGLGIFTYNGIPKSTYYAFWFLKKLGNHMVARGDGYFMTRRGDSFQIMLYHYKHYSDLYASGETFELNRTNRYTIFEPEPFLDLEIILKALPFPRYEITEYNLSRHSGSSYDKWVEMGAPSMMNGETKEMLKNLSCPMIKTYEAKVEKEQIILHQILDLLEVRLLILNPA